MDDWRITFVETGLQSNIGQRLKAVEGYLGDDEIFLANYADGLTNMDLNEYLDAFRQHDCVASFLCVRPPQTFHIVSTDGGDMVRDIRPVSSAVWSNGGFFAFRRSIFDYIREGEELVEEPFRRLIAENSLLAYRAPVWWQCMDTFRDREALEDLYSLGDPPWEVWKTPLGQQSPPASADPAG